jgi:hypothetical protein
LYWETDGDGLMQTLCIVKPTHSATIMYRMTALFELPLAIQSYVCCHEVRSVII